MSFPDRLRSQEAMKKELCTSFVGKNLLEVSSPSAILDVSKIRKNCYQMLEVVERLSFSWRAHIKTHKTIELTRLQVGNSTKPVNLVVSTVLEAENIVPFLLEMKANGRPINILYGFPVTPSKIPRLSAISKALGPGGLSLIVDHPDQLTSVFGIKDLSGHAPLLFLKIDMGTKRAGVAPNSPAASQLISDILAAEQASPPKAIFYGLYAHAGQSYSGSSRTAAVDYLRQEFEALLVTSESVRSDVINKPLLLTVGATPTAIAVQNLLEESSELTETETIAVSALKATIEAIKARSHTIEIHAGVYTVLDLQQLATHALPIAGPNQMLGWDDLALTVLAEVASIYPGRAASGSSEALVAAGSLALGREPCKAYTGWGIMSPWNRNGDGYPGSGLEQHEGWRVGRINQEHGVLTWSGDPAKMTPLNIGQKIRIWPNHACITGACFDWYLVVDSTRKGKEDEIVDVWPRWRGW